jgi:YtoQ family protein
MNLNVYLSGEIHTDWRQRLKDGCEAHNLSIVFTSAVTNHEASDAAGDILGVESANYWRDHKSAKVNAIRIKTLIESCDVAVIRFGDKYKQWNAAFDAYCINFCRFMVTPVISTFYTKYITCGITSFMVCDSRCENNR